MKQLSQYLTAFIVGLQVASGIIVSLAVNGTEQQQIEASNIYFLFNATCWVFAFTIIALLTSGLFRQLTWVVVLLWVGKLIDEIWFDPTLICWNDILNFGIAENIALILITRHITKNK